MLASCQSTEENSLDDAVTLEDIILVLKKNQKELIKREDRIITYIQKEVTTAKEELKKEAITSKEIITKKYQKELIKREDRIITYIQKEVTTAKEELKKEAITSKEIITKKFHDEIKSLKQQLLLVKEKDYEETDRIYRFLKDELAAGKEFITKKFQDEVDSLKQQLLLLKEEKVNNNDNDDDDVNNNDDYDDDNNGNIKDDEEEDDDEAEVKDDEAEAEVVEKEEGGSSVGTVIDLEDEAADDIYYKKWETKYKLFKKYVSKNDGKIPTYKCEVDGFNLGNWVHNQRTIYNFLKSNPGKVCHYGKMTKRRKDDLEKIESWTWKAYEKETSVVDDNDNNNDDYDDNDNFNIEDDEEYKKWKKKYKLLKKYVDDNDGIIPTHKCEVDGIKLGNWVRSQRNIYNFLKSNPGQRCGTGKMTKRRKDDLEKIESWTWKAKRRKDDLEKIKSWTWVKNSKKKETSVVDDNDNNNDDYDDNDNFNIEDDEEEDDDEAEVVEKEEGGSSVGTVIDLEDEAADDSRYKKWETKYKLFKKYVSKNDGKIPTNRCKVDGIKLGIWANNQRTIYNFLKSNPGKICPHGMMTKRRKDDLEKIESWTWKAYGKE